MENASEIFTELVEELSSMPASELVSEAEGFFGSTENILESLKIMGFGMVGIFIVTAIIVILVTLLNKSTSGIKKKKDKSNK